MSAIFALANQKGGVAKTTTTGILAAGLKSRLQRATIDCDPQGNLSMSVAAENQDSATMYEVMKGTVSAREAIQHTPSCDIIPANTILAGIEQELHNVGKEMTLREKLRDEPDRRCGRIRLHSYRLSAVAWSADRERPDGCRSICSPDHGGDLCGVRHHPAV